MSRARHYLLMPWGRVGSNLLLDIFEKSGSFQIHNEPLTGIRTRSKNADHDQREWYRANLALKPAGVHLLINLSIRSMVDKEYFLSEFRKEDATFMFLTRRNPVHVILSAIKAQHYADVSRERLGSPRWASYSGEEIFEVTPVDLNHFSRLLKALLDEREVFDAFLDQLGGKLFYYEDIALSLDMVVEEMSWAMGVRPPRSRSSIVKTISRPYSEEFANYDAVVDLVRRDFPMAAGYV